jgi:hypothetical protein
MKMAKAKSFGLKGGSPNAKSLNLVTGKTYQGKTGRSGNGQNLSNVPVTGRHEVFKPGKGK